MEEIVLTAILNRISTTPDGGWRITFDVPQSETKAVTQAATMRDVTFKLVLVQEWNLNPPAFKEEP